MIDIIFNFLIQFDLLIKNNLELSLILYFLFSFLFFTFSLPGSLIIILASSFFFGFITGFIINITTIVLGSLCFFLFFKNLFKKYFNKQIEKFSDKLNKIIKKSSFEYLVLLRLIFGVPLFVQNTITKDSAGSYGLLLRYINSNNVFEIGLANFIKTEDNTGTWNNWMLGDGIFSNLKFTF